MTYRIDVKTVREAARGHWDTIFCALAPTLKAAMQRSGKHVPCPVHGGKDGFRLFADYQKAGSCVCNTCGTFRDGFAALEWLHGWSFAETLEKVARVLGLNPSQREEVLEREQLNRVYRGVVLSMDEPTLEPDVYEGFVVRIKDEISGSVRKLGTQALKSALDKAEVRTFDRVEIILLARDYVRTFDGGDAIRFIWTVKRLQSKEVEDRLKQDAVLYNQRLAAAIRYRWLKALPFDLQEAQQKPLAVYLHRRGLLEAEATLFKDVRFEDRVFDPETRGWYCAMSAAVRDINGHLVTVHRTLLSALGTKAEIASPKRLKKLPEGRTINGCAVHFGEPQEVLALAEGIETALSVAIATGLPCWSCISAGGLERIVVPDRVKRVLVFADKDRSGTGEQAAEMLCQRLQSEVMETETMKVPFDIPKCQKGIDWNDVLVRMGPSAFPDI